MTTPPTQVSEELCTSPLPDPCDEREPVNHCRCAKCRISDGPISARSLQTVIDSPKFLDYERVMAQELLQARATIEALTTELGGYRIAEPERTEAVYVAMARANAAQEQVEALTKERDEAMDAGRTLADECDRLIVEGNTQIERLETALTESVAERDQLRRMHEQMCNLAVERYNEVEALTKAYATLTTALCESVQEREELKVERDKLRSQLPPEMQACMIRFIECEKGHGRLTATNWIYHGCHHCEIEALRLELAAVRKDADAAIDAQLAKEPAHE